MDDALHELSTSLLRIPTRAITTLPRDEDMQPINERFDPGADGSASVEVTNSRDERSAENTATPPADFGGNWIMGNEKGVYLRVTNRSVVANDETDEESDAMEEFQFPFSRSRLINANEDDDRGNGDGGDDEEERKREEEEEVLEEERREQDLHNDQLAWSFFAGSISRVRAESILEWVANRKDGHYWRITKFMLLSA